MSSNYTDYAGATPELSREEVERHEEISELENNVGGLMAIGEIESKLPELYRQALSRRNELPFKLPPEEDLPYLSPAEQAKLYLDLLDYRDNHVIRGSKK